MPKRLRRSSQCRGVSLVEVVVASALLVASLIPILRALTVSQMTARRITLTSRSLIVAQGCLEQIRAQAETHYAPSFAINSKDCGDFYLATVTDDADPRCRRVTISVGYDRDESQTLSADECLVTLTSCVARHEGMG